MLPDIYSKNIRITAPIGLAIELAAIFIVSIVLQVLAMNPSINPYDEGLILVGAQRVVSGEVPYRDFWTMYAPGQFYVMAMLFQVLGEHAFIGRIYEFLVRALILVLGFALMRPFVTGRVNWVATIVVCILMISNWSYIFPIFPALVFTLAAAICVASYISKPQMQMAFGAGVFSGLSAVFRHDVGFASSLACGMGIASVHLMIDSKKPIFPRLQEMLRANLALAAGALLMVVPLLSILIWYVPIKDLYQNLISIPFFVYPKVRSLPFPPVAQFLKLGFAGQYGYLRGLIVYVPIVVVFTAMIFIGCSRRWNENLQSARQTVFSVFLIFLTAMLFLKGIVRVSPEHVILSVVAAILLLASLTNLNFFALKVGKAALALVALVAAVPLLAFLEQATGQIVSNVGPGGLVHLCREPELPKLRCMKTVADDVNTVRMIDGMTGLKDKIYVGAGRHDKLFANNISIYFLASRLPATKWHDLHPGVETTLSVQQEMIADLQINRPKLIVIDPTFDGAEEPNSSRESGGITLLDEYIAEDYRQIFVGNPKRLLERLPKP